MELHSVELMGVLSNTCSISGQFSPVPKNVPKVCAVKALWHFNNFQDMQAVFLLKARSVTVSSLDRYPPVAFASGFTEVCQVLCSTDVVMGKLVTYSETGNIQMLHYMATNLRFTQGQIEDTMELWQVHDLFLLFCEMVLSNFPTSDCSWMKCSKSWVGSAPQQLKSKCSERKKKRDSGTIHSTDCSIFL